MSWSPSLKDVHDKTLITFECHHVQSFLYLTCINESLHNKGKSWHYWVMAIGYWQSTGLFALFLKGCLSTKIQKSYVENYRLLDFRLIGLEVVKTLGCLHFRK